MTKQPIVCAGCGRLYRNRCERCNPKTNRENHSDSRWRKLSLTKRAANPLCEDCERDGYVKAASEVHHDVPVSVDPSKKYEWANLVSLCSACHRKRHD